MNVGIMCFSIGIAFSIIHIYLAGSFSIWVKSPMTWMYTFLWLLSGTVAIIYVP